MRAKDYAKKFNDNPTMKTFMDIADSFVRECGELLKSRHCQTDAAAIAIFKEQDQKWVAFSNLVPGVKRDGFRILVKEAMPAIYEVMGWGNLTMREPDDGKAAPKSDNPE